MRYREPIEPARRTKALVLESQKSADQLPAERVGQGKGGAFSRDRAGVSCARFGEEMARVNLEMTMEERLE
jgi:hypothetical protein